MTSHLDIAEILTPGRAPDYIGDESALEVAIAQAHALIDIAESLRTIATRPDSDEIERLTRWKAEALPVLDGLQELGKALGLPLGERITGPAALAAVEALKLRATDAEANARQVHGGECDR